MKNEFGGDQEWAEIIEKPVEYLRYYERIIKAYPGKAVCQGAF